jgi:monofunctional glycosyltransferase
MVERIAQRAQQGSRGTGRVRRRRRSWLRRILLLAVGVIFILPVLLIVLFRFVPPPITPLMLDTWISNGTISQSWVPLSAISRNLVRAVIASEDTKFCSHYGFDWDAIDSAIVRNASGRNLRGASTISQQTAKNLFLWNGRSFVRKGLEAYFTVLIELTWPKQRILEVYVNIAELGNGIYGVGAASEAYFHASPAQLGPALAARLAAVLPNPIRLHADRPSVYVQGRANWIQQQMNHLGGPAYIEGRAAPRPGH